MVKRSLDAADKFNQESGISTEIIDIRSIVPLDLDTILTSVEKTSRLLIVHEDTIFQGFGAEIAAQISNKGFSFLDAPIGRVAALHTPIPYAPILEKQILPDDEDIYGALKSLSEY